MAGLERMEEKVWNLLRRHDVIGLSETKVESKGMERVRARLKGYDV